MANDDEKNVCGSTETKSGEPCQRPAGWGTSHNGEGRCDDHPGRGAPEGNDNAVGNEGGPGAEVTHGIYADVNKLYNEEFSADMVAVVDSMAADLYGRYEELHGEPGSEQRSRMFEIAMNVAKGIHADNWAVDKPDELKTSSPLIDRDTEVVPIGNGETEAQVKYKETVPVGTQQRYRREDRQWLKSMGMLENDPDSKAASALEGGLDLNLSSEDKDVLDETFGGDE